MGNVRIKTRAFKELLLKTGITLVQLSLSIGLIRYLDDLALVNYGLVSKSVAMFIAVGVNPLITFWYSKNALGLSFIGVQLIFLGVLVTFFGSLAVNIYFDLDYKSFGIWFALLSSILIIRFFNTWLNFNRFTLRAMSIIGLLQISYMVAVLISGYTSFFQISALYLFAGIVVFILFIRFKEFEASSLIKVDRHYLFLLIASLGSLALNGIELLVSAKIYSIQLVADLVKFFMILNVANIFIQLLNSTILSRLNNTNNKTYSEVIKAEKARFYTFLLALLAYISLIFIAAPIIENHLGFQVIDLRVSMLLGLIGVIMNYLTGPAGIILNMRGKIVSHAYLSLFLTLLYGLYLWLLVNMKLNYLWLLGGQSVFIGAFNVSKWRLLANEKE